MIKKVKLMNVIDKMNNREEGEEHLLKALSRISKGNQMEVPIFFGALNLEELID